MSYAGGVSAPAAAPPLNPLLRVPPPLLFLGTFGLGIAVGAALPAWAAPPAVARVLDWLGWTLVGAGTALTAASMTLFARARTTIIPVGRAGSLVTRGPYRFTRNPMYLALTLLDLGFAALFRYGGAPLILPLPIAILDRLMIPFEERRLREVFGQTYADYCARVRRWV